MTDPEPCTVPPGGWYCTRGAGHDGPCAAWPDASAELQALAEKMVKALGWGDLYDARETTIVGICARAAADHFAARVARADAIEAAARKLIAAQDAYMAMQKNGFARSPGPTIDRLQKARKAWAALEAS